jgi:hypothetical protein
MTQPTKLLLQTSAPQKFIAYSTDELAQYPLKDGHLRSQLQYR